MVHVLIPAHNNKKEVIELLGCLDRQTYKDISIVLVDDGSTDNTEEEVRKSYPDTVILKGDGNLWWTGTNVKGVDYILEHAQENDFILVLNNDLTVENNYVAHLVDASNAFNRAIVGSLTVNYYNHDFWESGLRLGYNLSVSANRDKDRIKSNEYDHDVDVLPGRGTLVPIEVFKRIGNFNDKKLPHYGADYEFTLRAKRAGFKLLVAHNARVFAKLNITGLLAPENRIISLKECYELLISPKAITTSYYRINFVWLCSDRKHKLSNTMQCISLILTNTVCKTVLGYPFYLLITKIAGLLRKNIKCCALLLKKQSK